MKSIKFLLAAVLILTFTISAVAQVNDWKEIQNPPLREFQIPEAKRIELPNGAVVFLQEDHELPLIDGSIVIRGGSREEPAQKIGLVEIYGEVWRTGGTKTKTGDELDDFLEARAAKVETRGDIDSTSIHWNSLKADFNDTYAVVFDLLRNPEFRADKIELAKYQMNTNIARCNDDPGAIAIREISRLGYGKSNPYARIPEYDTVSSVNRDDLIAWHTKYENPANMIIVVAGDFDSKAMEQAIRKTIGALPKGARATVPAIQAAPARPGIYMIEKDDVTQSNIRMVHSGIRKDDPDYYAVQVMNEVFGGGFSARLFSHIRTKKGLAYSVYGAVDSAYDHPALFTLSMGTKSGTTVAAINALNEEIDKIQNEPISDEEVLRAKDSILNSFVFQYDSKKKVLDQQILLEFHGYPKDFLQKYQKGVASVTAAQVSAAAKKHIRKGELAVLVVGKSKDFDGPLSTFGSVTPIDITIPQPVGH